VLADDHNVHGRKFFFENSGGFQAVHVWHGHIEEDNVRQVFSRLNDGIGSVLRFAGNFDVCLGVKELANRATNTFVVVYD
jgi:hypothetical protein